LYAQLTEEESIQTGNNDINNSTKNKDNINNSNSNKLILWVEIKDYISTATAENIADAIDKVSIPPTIEVSLIHIQL
jgi:hypothetical protein